MLSFFHASTLAKKLLSLTLSSRSAGEEREPGQQVGNSCIARHIKCMQRAKNRRTESSARRFAESIQLRAGPQPCPARRRAGFAWWLRFRRPCLRRDGNVVALDLAVAAISIRKPWSLTSFSQLGRTSTVRPPGLAPLFTQVRRDGFKTLLSGYRVRGNRSLAAGSHARHLVGLHVTEA